MIVDTTYCLSSSCQTPEMMGKRKVKMKEENEKEGEGIADCLVALLTG